MDSEIDILYNTVRKGKIIKILYNSLSFRSLPWTYDWAHHEHDALDEYLPGDMQVQAGEVLRCAVLYLSSRGTSAD